MPAIIRPWRGGYCLIFPITVSTNDARPLTGSRLCPGPSGWANAATDSVSGRVWAGMTSCPAHRAILHAFPLCNALLYAVESPVIQSATRCCTLKCKLKVVDYVNNEHLLIMEPHADYFYCSMLFIHRIN